MSTTAQPGLSDLPGRLLRLADQLEEYVAKYEASRDSSAVFTYAYVTITRSLANRLVDAKFEHPEWVVSLAEYFAAHYIAALGDWDVGSKPVPPAWKIVFENHTSEPDISIGRSGFSHDGAHRP
jgi:hypothetical protein